MYDFSANYNTSVSDIVEIYKYLIKKYNTMFELIRQCLS